MRVGPWWIQPYTLRISLGALLGLVWLWCYGPKRGFPRQEMMRWLGILSLVAVLSGRLGYVARHHTYFAQHPRAAWQLRAVGGLQSEAALAGGLSIALTWSWKTARRPAAVLALLAPAALCVASSAWWACLDTGCAWGCDIAKHDMARYWLARPLPDLYHIRMMRYPVQILGTLWASVLILWAIALQSQGALTLVLYFIGAATLNFHRADPVPLVLGIRADIVYNLLLASWVGTALLSCDGKRGLLWNNRQS